MTIEDYLKFLLAGVLGIAFQVSAVKMPSLKKRSEAANKPFSAIEYFKNDWITIFASGCSVLIFLMVLGEVLEYKPTLSKWVTTSFVFVGFTGSSIFQSIFSRTEKQILKIIKEDKKETEDPAPPSP